eukprot:SAG31_NODE_47157_length_251_cov_1.013158_1_plen_83_part_11
MWVQYVQDCSRFEPDPTYQVLADPSAVARVLQVNHNIKQLQENFEGVINLEKSMNSYEWFVTVSTVVMNLQLIQKLDFHPYMG